ncbi:heat shock protein 30C-like [Pyxicephalus adspersus]
MFPHRHYGPYRDIHSLNPNQDVQILQQQLEEDMQRMTQDVERRMQWMQQVCQIPPHHLAIQSGPLATPAEMFPSRQWKGDFELSLDVDRIPPEELTVKAEGRKLIVVGQHNEKKETPDGGIVEEHREWHREADLPEDVNPRDVLCSMSRDGRLHFRAPRLAQPEAKYRIMPVNRVIHIPIMVDSKWALHSRRGISRESFPYQ